MDSIQLNNFTMITMMGMDMGTNKVVSSYHGMSSAAAWGWSIGIIVALYVVGCMVNWVLNNKK